MLDLLSRYRIREWLQSFFTPRLLPPSVSGTSVISISSYSGCCTWMPCGILNHSNEKDSGGGGDYEGHEAQFGNLFVREVVRESLFYISLVPVNHHSGYRLLKACFYSTMKSYSYSQPSVGPTRVSILQSHLFVRNEASSWAFWSGLAPSLCPACLENFKYRWDPCSQCGLMANSYLQCELSYDL